MNLLWPGFIILLLQCLTLASAGKKPKGQFSKIKATIASRNQLRRSNSKSDSNNESEEAKQDFRFLSEKILDNLPEKGSSVEEDPLLQYHRSKFNPLSFLKGKVSNNIELQNNRFVKLTDKKTVKSENSQSLESNDQKASDSVNDSSDNGSVENRANENQSEGQVAPDPPPLENSKETDASEDSNTGNGSVESGENENQSEGQVAPDPPPLENSKETNASEDSNAGNGSVESGENENQSEGHQSISGEVPGPPPMENSEENDASKDSNTDNGSVESNANDNQPEGHQSISGVVPGLPPTENSKETDDSEDSNTDNESLEGTTYYNESTGHESNWGVVPGPPPMENSEETDNSEVSAENDTKENQSEENGGSDSSSMDEHSDSKVNKLKESIEKTAVGLKDIEHVVSPDTFKEFLQEIKEGSKADLFNTPHFSYSNKFKDLGRRSVRQYSKAEKLGSNIINRIEAGGNTGVKPKKLYKIYYVGGRNDSAKTKKDLLSLLQDVIKNGRPNKAPSSRHDGIQILNGKLAELNKRNDLERKFGKPYSYQQKNTGKYLYKFKTRNVSKKLQNNKNNEIKPGSMLEGIVKILQKLAPNSVHVVNQ